MVPSGSWAQFVHAPVTSVATIPDGVTDEQGASLPVAGLTALHALRKAGLVLGKKVLVDGASGGVGQFAIQLAAASGARVYSHIRREAQRSLVQSASTGGVIVGNTL
jgi:NADPH:quinone reductase-like Zn-dependent oxidoreductase